MELQVGLHSTLEPPALRIYESESKKQFASSVASLLKDGPLEVLRREERMLATATHATFQWPTLLYSKSLYLDDDAESVTGLLAASWESTSDARPNLDDPYGLQSMIFDDRPWLIKQYMMTALSAFKAWDPQDHSYRLWYGAYQSSLRDGVVPPLPPPIQFSGYLRSQMHEIRRRLFLVRTTMRVAKELNPDAVDDVNQAMLDWEKWAEACSLATKHKTGDRAAMKKLLSLHEQSLPDSTPVIPTNDGKSVLNPTLSSTGAPPSLQTGGGWFPFTEGGLGDDVD